MRREVAKATVWGLFVTLAIAGLITLGSRNLSHFDAALVAYTFAFLFANFGLTYRYALWLQRPPTALYWRRGWQVFFKRNYRLRNLGNWFRRVTEDFLLNRFIWSRTWLRGLSHGLIMWGCILATAITFPLVFGWLHFASAPDDPSLYRVVLFGFPTFSFPVDSFLGAGIFHGLVWSALLVIPGVMLAMRRRMREEDVAAMQLFAEDFLPLILLFAVSLSGLMLTASYTWMKGYGYDFLAILHAITVIFTFLWLPFGKLFHVFQRPAQLGARFYKDVSRHEEAAHCRRCNHAFTSRMHVEDLIRIEHELGYTYAVAQSPAEHYQWICPPCRRASFAIAQGRLRQGLLADTPTVDLGKAARPHYVNPAPGEGPLGEEDAQNFHP